jgi:hypothetical protein
VNREYCRHERSVPNRVFDDKTLLLASCAARLGPIVLSRLNLRWNEGVTFCHRGPQAATSPSLEQTARSSLLAAAAQTDAYWTCPQQDLLVRLPKNDLIHLYSCRYGAGSQGFLRGAR